MGTISLVFVIKQYLDAENEDHVNVVRMGYVAALLVQLIILLFIKNKIQGLKGDESIVKVKKKENPFDSEEKDVRMSVMEYDDEQVQMNRSLACIQCLDLPHYGCLVFIAHRPTKSSSNWSWEAVSLLSSTTNLILSCLWQSKCSLALMELLNPNSSR